MEKVSGIIGFNAYSRLVRPHLTRVRVPIVLIVLIDPPPPPVAQIVFIVAKMTLGSKEMRTALFFYVLAMHLLVFVTTYDRSHASTCESYHSQEALAHFHGGVPLPEGNGGVVVAAAKVD